MLRPFKDPRTGVYYFRKVVPKLLKDRLGKTEIKVSLGTKDSQEAVIKFYEETIRCEKLFDNAKDGFTLSNKKAKELAGSWLTSALIADDIRRSEENPEDPNYNNNQHTYYEGLLSVLNDAVEGYAYGEVKQEFDEIIRINGLPLQKESSEFYLLANELLLAKIRYYHILDKRHLGDYSDKVDDVLSEYPNPLEGMGHVQTIKGLFKDFSKRSAKSKSTISTYENAVNLFMELHHDCDASGITRPMVREYKDALLQVPRLRSGLNHLSLPELVKYAQENNIDDYISPSTVNKNIKAISAILSWSEKNGYFDECTNWSNPATGVRADDSKRDARLPFDDEDIDSIFDDEYNSLTSAKFWVPLISLCSGARLEEIGQLLVSDIMKDEEYDFWYMDINDKDGKSVKNKSSIRLIPIHQKIIDLGFLEFVGESGRVFQELKRNKQDKLTAGLSKWFGGYKKRKGITSKQKTFHSFRHLFKDIVRSQIANEELSDAITGHSNPSIGRQYGLGFRLSVLNDQMQTLKFNIDEIRRYHYED
jgi:integrase